MSSCHNANDLIHVFNSCFKEKYQTELIGAAEEPLYLPAAKPGDFHQIHFTKDYFSSALHECAHWFIAGAERRLLIDYGYWYEPDGRDASQQALFQKVEIKPQALEWILSEAAGYRFSISLDNLNGSRENSEDFEKAVWKQVLSYRENGLPLRAESFKLALEKFYCQK